MGQTSNNDLGVSGTRTLSQAVWRRRSDFSLTPPETVFRHTVWEMTRTVWILTPYKPFVMAHFGKGSKSTPTQPPFHQTVQVRWWSTVTFSSALLSDAVYWWPSACLTRSAIVGVVQSAFQQVQARRKSTVTNSSGRVVRCCVEEVFISCEFFHFRRCPIWVHSQRGVVSGPSVTALLWNWIKLKCVLHASLKYDRQSYSSTFIRFKGEKDDKFFHLNLYKMTTHTGVRALARQANRVIQNFRSDARSTTHQNTPNPKVGWVKTHLLLQFGRICKQISDPSIMTAFTNVKKTFVFHQSHGTRRWFSRD